MVVMRSILLVSIMVVVVATSLTGPAIREVPVSAMAWQPPEQKVVWTQFLDFFWGLIIFSYFLTMMVTVMSTSPMVIESIENCQ